MAIDLVLSKSPATTDLVFGSDTEVFTYIANGNTSVGFVSSCIATYGISPNGTIDLVFSKSAATTNLVFGSDTEVFTYIANGNTSVGIVSSCIATHSTSSNGTIVPLSIISTSVSKHGVASIPKYDRLKYSNINFTFKGETFTRPLSTDFKFLLKSPHGLLNISTNANATLVELDRGRSDLKFSTNSLAQHFIGVDGSVSIGFTTYSVAATSVFGDVISDLSPFTTYSYIRHGVGGYAETPLYINTDGSFKYLAIVDSHLPFYTNSHGVYGVVGSASTQITYNTSADSVSSVAGFGESNLGISTISFSNIGNIGYGNSVIDIHTNGEWEYDGVVLAQPNIQSNSFGFVGVTGFGDSTTQYTISSISAFGVVIGTGSCGIDFQTTQYTKHGVSGTAKGILSLSGEGEQIFKSVGDAKCYIDTYATVGYGASGLGIAETNNTSSGVGIVAINGTSALPIDIGVVIAGKHGVSAKANSTFQLTTEASQKYYINADIDSIISSESIGTHGVTGVLVTTILYHDAYYYDNSQYRDNGKLATTVRSIANAIASSIGIASGSISVTTNAKTGFVGSGESKLEFSSYGGLFNIGNVDTEIKLNSIIDVGHGVSGYGYHNILSNDPYYNSEHITPTVSSGSAPAAVIANIALTISTVGDAVLGETGYGNGNVTITSVGDYRAIGRNKSEIGFSTESTVNHGVSGSVIGLLDIQPSYIISIAVADIITRSSALFAILVDGSPSITFTSTALSGVPVLGVGVGTSTFSSYSSGGTSVYSFGEPNTSYNINTITTHGVSAFANTNTFFDVNATAEHKIVGVSNNINVALISSVYSAHGVGGYCAIDFIVAVEDVRFYITKTNDHGFVDIPSDQYGIYPENQSLKSITERTDFNTDISITSNLVIRSVRLADNNNSGIYSEYINTNSLRLFGNYNLKNSDIFTYKIDNEFFLKSKIEPDDFMAVVEYEPDITNMSDQSIKFDVEYLDPRGNLKVAGIYLHQLVYWNIDYSLENFYTTLNKGKI